MLRRIWHSPYILLILATLFWGGNAVTGKYLADTIPPNTLSFTRLFLSTIIILPFIYPSLKKEWVAARKHRNLIILLALTGVVGFNLLCYWAAHYTSAVNMALFNSTTPFFMVILAYFLLKEKMKRSFVIAMLISFTGVICVMTQGSIQRLFSLQLNVGDLILLIAVLLWSIYSIYIKKTTGLLSPLALFGYCSIVGTLVMFPASVVELYFVSIGNIGGPEILALAYLGIFPTIGSFLFWNRAVLLIGPSTSSLFQNLIPIWGALLAFLVLGEQITVAHWLGGLLIFGGIAISRVNVITLADIFKKKTKKIEL